LTIWFPCVILETENTQIVYKGEIVQDSAERLRILEHSMEKFKSVGFIKISMDEIASDLKMSKKTIYKYFHSKEELVEKSLETLMHSFKSEYEIIFA